MAFNYAKLRGKIREVFGTQDIFAKHMNLSERTLSLKLQGKRDWKRTEIENACHLLQIPIESIPNYFFTSNVQIV